MQGWPTVNIMQRLHSSSSGLQEGKGFAEKEWVCMQGYRRETQYLGFLLFARTRYLRASRLRTQHGGAPLSSLATRT